MQVLNQAATKVFLTLTEGLDGASRHSRRFDANDYWPECNGGIMAVHVDRLGTISGHPWFSVAHYYKQNGDLITDPEMEFINVNGNIYPANFTQQSLGVRVESIRVIDGKLMVSKKTQADHVSFANQWMENIKDQQDL